MMKKKSNQEEEHIVLSGKELKEVDKEAYLFSIVFAKGETDGDIKARFVKARHALNTPEQV